LAQAALGGGLLAFARIESVEAIHPERGMEGVRAGAREGVSALLKAEQRRAESGLKRFEALRQQLDAAGKNALK
jgi:hypothetical protein